MNREKTIIRRDPIEDPRLTITCQTCGKQIELYFNGGELDERDCCGLTYQTRATGYELVVLASAAKEGR